MGDIKAFSKLKHWGVIEIKSKRPSYYHLTATHPGKGTEIVPNSKVFPSQYGILVKKRKDMLRDPNWRGYRIEIVAIL